ncbi:hypothetical protein NMY22_g1105 [Coprinellus aureogranulatus]|nr:hypothetical protein NMY22_g1105 [Coprinellus aureogranulatus]
MPFRKIRKKPDSMPARRKPTSGKKKKEEQKLKRAIKRGDVEAPEKKKPQHRRRVGPTGNGIGGSESPAKPRLELQSTFIKLSPTFLEETKRIAGNVPLQRPLPPDAAILANVDTGNFEANALTCLNRPKWRYEQSKLEVERNEEGMFKKWLAQNDQIVQEWQAQLDRKRRPVLEDDPEKPPAPLPDAMPASPTIFERNLEVWRQLWRVTEISQILLILVDSRCPSLHFPPSVAGYLKNQKIILVLTKVDITGPERTEAWKSYLREQYPDIPFVEVESYVAKDQTAVHQGRRQFESSIPENFRVKLIDTIKRVHAELLEPPAKVKENPERLKNWVPPVKPEVDWDAVISAKGDKVGLAVGGPAAPRPTEGSDDGPGQGGKADSESERRVPEVLTIGLIGQPNVGKSSLLNALFGAQRVTASRTPGKVQKVSLLQSRVVLTFPLKTKHFQTLFWTSDVRLVDCPGLVFPNFVPMELQVLSGILPISRVSAVAACIHYAAQHLPLERIYQLRHPSLDEKPKVDKRTWREGMKRSEVVAPEGEDTKVVWTAMDILTAYANYKGYTTAKAGRPDVNRAGNAILRTLAEGRIAWGFWPPGMNLEKLDPEGLGIYISGTEAVGTDGELTEAEEDLSAAVDEDASQEEYSEEEGSDSEDGEDDEDEDEGDTGQNVGGGRFGALTIDDGEESDEASEE